jgi:hypothetical protein
LGEVNSSGVTHFQVQLPNNDTIQIVLSVQLLKREEVITTETTTTTTTPLSITILEHQFSKRNPEEFIQEPAASDQVLKAETVPQYVSVVEAIEALRQELIEIETNLNSIIEDGTFYRRFLLEHDNQHEIGVRCSYNSNMKIKTLKIECLEFKEIAVTNILSNGKIEQTEIDTSYRSKFTLLDLRKIKKSKKYHMNVS